jgi:arylsulfatase A-like enzyme
MLIMASTPSRPNVLVLFCDQFRTDLIGAYGSELVRTPNIDALSADSVIFDRAYTPTPICSPARASFMTGVYPHVHHMFNNSSPKYSYCEHLRPDMPMICDWADAQTDYQTAYFGKWHIGPADDLFATSFHHTQRPGDADLPFLTSSHWHPNKALGELVQPYGNNGRAGLLDVPMERFPDVVAAQYSIDFLHQRHAQRPFLCYCSFPGPHQPWMIPADYGLRYQPEDIPVWSNRSDTFQGKPINQQKLRLMERDAGHRMRISSDRDLQELLACCFSYVELIDEQVGRVVATLKELGLYEDTTVILAADHGDMAGSHGFISKGGYSYDEIYRVPLIVKPAASSVDASTPATAPAPGRHVQAPVNLLDVTATIAHQMQGQEVASFGGPGLQGASLAPLLCGQADSLRPVHYGEFHGDWYGHYSIRMVTDGDWKLAWNLTDLCELYDLRHDPDELHNLFYVPQHRQTRDHYMDLLIAEAARLDDAHVKLLTPQIEDQIPAASGVAVVTESP